MATQANKTPEPDLIAIISAESIEASSLEFENRSLDFEDLAVTRIAAPVAIGITPSIWERR
jgi:hypothetical protein